jgi:hypothetical protein
MVFLNFTTTGKTDKNTCSINIFSSLPTSSAKGKMDDSELNSSNSSSNSMSPSLLHECILRSLQLLKNIILRCHIPVVSCSQCTIGDKGMPSWTQQKYSFYCIELCYRWQATTICFGHLVAIIRLIQVFEDKACYFTFSLGSEISDRPSLWNGTTKYMVCLS